MKSVHRYFKSLNIILSYERGISGILARNLTESQWHLFAFITAKFALRIFFGIRHALLTVIVM